MKDAPRPAGEPNRQSFWSTLPGILTAIAAVLTAVTGLTVALNQVRSATPSASPQPTVSTPMQATSTVPVVVRKDEAAGQGTAPAGVRNDDGAAPIVTLPGGQEARMSGGLHTYRILDARVEPFNRESRALRLNVRFLNNSKTLDRTYYSTFRLLVDDLPLAPVDPPLEQIEALSALDVDYTFRVPASARHAVLRINWNDEVSELPIELPIS